MLDDRKFEVLEHEKKSGLTVGSYSRKPGFIFRESDWTGSRESLKAALENKRCKEIFGKSEKNDSKKEKKKSDEDDDK